MRNRLLAVGLALLGLLQVGGRVVGSSTLVGVGLATAASPAPRVFTSVGGYEALSTRFFLEIEGPGGRRTVEVGTERAAGLRGPYNRRNVPGAALAFGPVLRRNEATREMVEVVTSAVLEGSVPEELGLELAPGERIARIRYRPAREVPPGLPLVVEVGP